MHGSAQFLINIWLLVSTQREINSITLQTMIVIHYRKHYERKKYMSYIKLNPKFKDIELPWKKDLVK